MFGKKREKMNYSAVELGEDDLLTLNKVYQHVGNLLMRKDDGVKSIQRAFLIFGGALVKKLAQDIEKNGSVKS